VLVRLSGVAVGQKARELRDGKLGFLQGQPACLQARRVQQVFHHFGQAVSFFLDYRQALGDNFTVPLHVIPPQRADVTFDERDRGLELVADNRNEAGLHLFRGAEARDISHRGDDVHQCVIGGKKRPVAYPDRQRLAQTFPDQVAFQVENILAVLRPAAGNCRFQSGTLRRLCPADNLGRRLPNAGFLAGIQQPLQGFVHALHLQVRREDQDAVCRRIQQGFQAQGLLAGFVVQARIAHGNGCLVGKAGQQHAVVGGEESAVIAEHVNLPNDLLLENHVDAHASQHSHADIVQHAVDFRDVRFAFVFRLKWLRFQPALQVIEQRFGNALVHSDMPAAFVVFQRDEAGVAGQHLNCYPQDVQQQRVQVQLFGESAGNLEQVISLAYAVVGEHGSILTANHQKERRCKGRWALAASLTQS